MLVTELQEHLKRMQPEDLPNVHAKVGERMARSSEEIRSRLEEARRMNIDEMRHLQKYVCLSACIHAGDTLCVCLSTSLSVCSQQFL